MYGAEIEIGVPVPPSYCRWLRLTSERCDVVRSDGGMMFGATSGTGREGSGGGYAPAISGGGDARDEWNDEVVDDDGESGRSSGAMDASSLRNRLASASRSS
jgi:hypothetical protein